MGRPTTFPSPWRELAEILGGVAPMAEALGTAPRTLRGWADGSRRPVGAARKQILDTFREVGLPEPTFAGPPKGRIAVLNRKDLEEAVSLVLREYLRLAREAEDDPEWALQRLWEAENGLKDSQSRLDGVLEPMAGEIVERLDGRDGGADLNDLVARAKAVLKGRGDQAYREAIE